MWEDRRSQLAASPRRILRVAAIPGPRVAIATVVVIAATPVPPPLIPLPPPPTGAVRPAVPAVAVVLIVSVTGHTSVPCVRVAVTTHDIDPAAVAPIPWVAAPVTPPVLTRAAR